MTLRTVAVVAVSPFKIAHYYVLFSEQAILAFRRAIALCGLFIQLLMRSLGAKRDSNGRVSVIMKRSRVTSLGARPWSGKLRNVSLGAGAATGPARAIAHYFSRIALSHSLTHGSAVAPIRWSSLRPSGRRLTAAQGVPLSR